MALTTFPITYAEDTNNMDYGLRTNSGDNNDPGDEGELNALTPASKIAFEAMILQNITVIEMQDMRTYADMISFFQTYNLTATAVQTSKTNLKLGDIVQLKNSDSCFLVYLGKSSNGNIILEDVWHQFECSPESFDAIFTGNAIFINHTTQNMTTIDGNNINDNPIHDSTVQIGPIQSGLSRSGNLRADWKNAYLRPDFRNRALKLINGQNTKYNQCKAIFLHVRDNYDYNFHFGTQKSVDYVVNNRVGNCVELARVMMSLAESVKSELGVSHRFILANCDFHDGRYEHVWVQFQSHTGSWINADASNNNNAFGGHSGTNATPKSYCYTTDFPIN